MGPKLLFNPRPASLSVSPPPVEFGLDVVNSTGAEVVAEKVSGPLNPLFLEKLAEKHGDSTVFDRAGRLHLLFTDPAAVNQILVSSSNDFLKGDQEQALAASVGWGLLTHEGQTHKNVQTALRPSLRGEILERYLETVSALAKQTIKRLGELPSPLVGTARQFSQDSGEATLFGLPEPTRDYRYHEAIWSMNSFVQSEISEFEPAEVRKAKVSDFTSHKETIDRHVESLVDQWRANGRPLGNFLEYLFGARDSLADSVHPIREESSIFLQAATETTASLVSWTIVALNGQSHYWERLRDECLAANIDSYKSLKALPFLNAVIQETLRLFPPVWLIPRVARIDTEISGIRVPRGARVIVSPWVTQRREEYFRDAKTFVPERWLATGSASERRAFFPFGLGSRVCIGESFGKMTAAIFLYELCRTEKFVVLNSRNSEPDITSLISFPDGTLEFQML